MGILKKVVDLVETIPKGDRDSWEEYFMAQAYLISLRSTCGSRRVGSVIVNGLEKGKRRILASGYNGNPSGDIHCYEGGCPRLEARKNGTLKTGDYSDEFPCYAIHSEANALYQMSKLGTPAEGCILFSTTFPCRHCAEKILGTGIKKVYYYEGYPDEFSRKYFDKYGVKYKQIKI